FFAVVTSLLFATMSTAKPPELLEVLSQGRRILHGSGIGNRCQRFDSQIDPDRFAGCGLWIGNLLLYLDTDKPAPCLLRDRRRENLSSAGGNIVLLFQVKQTQPWQLHMLREDVNDSRQAKTPNPFLLALELGETELAFILSLFFEPRFAKEALIGLL